MQSRVPCVAMNVWQCMCGDAHPQVRAQIAQEKRDFFMQRARMAAQTAAARAEGTLSPSSPISSASPASYDERGQSGGERSDEESRDDRRLPGDADDGDQRSLARQCRADLMIDAHDNDESPTTAASACGAATTTTPTGAASVRQAAAASDEQSPASVVDVTTTNLEARLAAADHLRRPPLSAPSPPPSSQNGHSGAAASLSDVVLAIRELGSELGGELAEVRRRMDRMLACHCTKWLLNACH